LALAVAMAAACGGSLGPPAGPSPNPTLESPFEVPSDAARTVEPSPVLTGVFPGPDATIQPRQLIIPGLDVGSLVAIAAELGMACRSDEGGPPGSNGAYTLECQGLDASGTARLDLSALYVTLDGVITVSVLVLPKVWDGTLTDLSIAPRVMLPVADAIGGSAATDWLRAKMDDPACNQACVTSIQGAHIEVAVGLDGSRSLHAYPAAMP
jgi:hypothetical protein